MMVREGNRKLEQIARLLSRTAGRIEKWAGLQPPLEFCSHPGVEPAGTAEKVGERIREKVKDAIRYDSRWGFRRVLSQLRLQGRQSIADATERAVNDLLGTVKGEAQEAAENLSQRIYYAAIVKQAKLSASQIRDAAAELEKVVPAADAEALLNSINSPPSPPSIAAMNIPKPETVHQAIGRIEALKRELKEIGRVDYYGEHPVKADLLCEKLKKLVWYCVNKPSLRKANSAPITSLFPKAQHSFDKRLERLPRGCLSRLLKELIVKLTDKGVEQIVSGCTVNDLARRIRQAAFFRRTLRDIQVGNACLVAQRDVEVTLCQHEEFLSQKQYLGEPGLPAILDCLLKAKPESLDPLDSAVHRLRVVERRLGVVNAEAETRSGGPNGQGQPRETGANAAAKSFYYVEIDLAGRTVVVGDTTFTPSNKIWELLKELADVKRHDTKLPQVAEWKTAVDMLRRKVGKDYLQFVVESTEQGYKLAQNVKLKGGGQVSIRRTKQSR